MRPDPKYIVGIESSAAGLMSLTQLFRVLPPYTDMAFAIVSHVKTPEKFHLSGMLARFTIMPVIDAVVGMELRENYVYVLPQDARLCIDGRSPPLKFARDKTPGRHTQLNHFLISLAKAAGERSLAIFTSSEYGDGVEGGRFICEQGGRVFLLAGSLGIDGKLRAAPRSMDSGHAMQPEELAQQLMDIASRPMNTHMTGSTI